MVVQRATASGCTRSWNLHVSAVTSTGTVLHHLRHQSANARSATRRHRYEHVAAAEKHFRRPCVARVQAGQHAVRALDPAPTQFSSMDFRPSLSASRRIDHRDAKASARLAPPSKSQRASVRGHVRRDDVAVREKVRAVLGAAGARLSSFSIWKLQVLAMVFRRDSTRRVVHDLPAMSVPPPPPPSRPSLARGSDMRVNVRA